MQCLILAGGRGERMKPLTDRCPKALIGVNGVPFAHHQLDWLARQGVGRVVYSIGYLGSQVRDYVGDGGAWGLDIACVEDGEPLLGTAGAIRRALDAGLISGGFFVLYGDSYVSVDLASVWAASGGGSMPTLCVFPNDGRWDASNVIFDDGRVTLYEKGRNDARDIGMRHIDVGLSVLSADVIADEVPAGEACDLADIFHRLSRAGRLMGYEAAERFYEIGSPQGLAELEARLGGAEGGESGTR